jgi:hypothetical protein
MKAPSPIFILNKKEISFRRPKDQRAAGAIAGLFIAVVKAEELNMIALDLFESVTTEL